MRSPITSAVVAPVPADPDNSTQDELNDTKAFEMRRVPAVIEILGGLRSVLDPTSRSQAARVLARFGYNPGRAHWEAAKRVAPSQGNGGIASLGGKMSQIGAFTMLTG